MTQKTIDFAWTDQRRILRDCELGALAATDGRTVKAHIQKALLLAIDSFGRRCFASYDELARAANVSRRHAVRAVSVLLQIGVICKVQGRTAKNGPRVELTIVWSELALYCRESLATRFGRPLYSEIAADIVSAPGEFVSAPQSAVSAPQSAVSALAGTLRIGSINEDLSLRSGEREELIFLVAAAGVNAAAKAVDDALKRGVTPTRIRKFSSHHKDGALFHVLTNAEPEAPVDRGARPRRKPAGASKQSQAIGIIKQGRRAGKPDCEIEAALSAANLTWSDQDA